MQSQLNGNPLQSHSVVAVFIIPEMHVVPERDLLYGTNLISPNSMLDYLYSCVSRRSSIQQYIYEFI
jgi:hypothetical protein